MPGMTSSVRYCRTASSDLACGRASVEPGDVGRAGPGAVPYRPPSTRRVRAARSGPTPVRRPADRSRPARANGPRPRGAPTPGPCSRCPTAASSRRATSGSASRSTARPPARFVGGDELVDRADAADLERRAEPPRLDAQPREVLEGIADVHELPVDRGREPVARRRSRCPSRRSPCTIVVAVRGGRLAHEPFVAFSNVGLTSSTSSYAAQYCVTVSASSAPGTSAGSIACRPARNRPRSSTSTCARVVAYSSSRRIRRASVSPGTWAITRPAVPSSAPSSSTSTSGTARPARRHAAHRVGLEPHRARRRPDARAGRVAGSARGRSAVNDHVSRDAPPLSRCSPSMSTGAEDRRRGRPAAAQIPTLVPTGVSSDDLIEVLREAGAGQVAVRPACHAFGDPRHQAVAPVAQRDVRPHVAVDLVDVVVGRDRDGGSSSGTTRCRSRTSARTSRIGTQWSSP